MTSAECIHGFEPGLCDSCYPKVPVVVPRAARVSAPSRRAAASSGRPSSSGRARPPAAPSANLLDQRVFHVTALNNLDGIVGAGGLVAGELPTLDLSSALARELRASAMVPAGLDGAESPVSVYVPWYLSPDARVWNELRTGAAEPRWSAAARAVASVDLVVLVSTVRALTEDADPEGMVVADGDAAGSYTRFAARSDQVLRMLARLHGTDHALAAEVLVKDSVPFEAVQLIGVANEPRRDRVREILAGAGLRTKVAVYPPWFAPPA